MLLENNLKRYPCDPMFMGITLTILIGIFIIIIVLNTEGFIGKLYIFDFPYEFENKNGNMIRFKVYIDYKLKLKSYSKKNFDPFFAGNE